MTETKNEEVSVSLMDDTAFGMNLEVPYMDDDDDEPLGEPSNASGERAAERTKALDLDCVIINRDNNDSASGPAFLLRILAILSRCFSDNKSLPVPSVAGKFRSEIEEFMSGIRGYLKNIRGEGLSTNEEKEFRLLLPAWNSFLHSVPGAPSDINDTINKFILRQKQQRVGQWTADDNARIFKWLPRWNMFLKARAGQTLVARCSVCLTMLGFLLYIADLGSDIGTAIYYICNGQWRLAIATLCFFYAAVIINPLVKCTHIHCTGAADWVCYFASLLINLPDLKEYWAFCRLEWMLYKSPQRNARLVPEWHRRSYNVARLKLVEGVLEAWPQAILQLFLLLPDLHGAWTFTDYLRFTSVTLSMCSAALSIVNREKCRRIFNYVDVPLSAQVVLHVWAVSVSVSGLLSFTLIQIVHFYWCLASLLLHAVLFCVYVWRFKEEFNRTVNLTFDSAHVYVSPFIVSGSVTSRRVLHVINFLGYSAMTVVWALDTPLVSAHPALYTAIICFNAVIYAVGVGAWQLHEKLWPEIYHEYNGKYTRVV